MKGSLETRIGLFVALAMIAGVLAIELAGELNFMKKGFSLRSYFDSAGDLKEGDPVKLGGIPVGSVSRIGWSDQQPGKVEVVLQIEKGAPIKTDSTAEIRFQGLLGSQFVSLSFGSAAAPLADENAVLTSKYLPDLGDLMERMESVAGGVENMTKSFSGDSFGDLLAPLADFVKENTPRLTRTLENVEKVSFTISNGEGTMGKLIMQDSLFTETMDLVKSLESTFDKTGNNLDLALSEARETLKDARSVMQDVKNGEGTLGQLMTQKKLYHEMEKSMTNLREILEKINQGNGSVGQLVNDQVFFNNLKLTLQKIEKATETLEDTGPLNVINTIAGRLF
ncbi:MAG: MlaD family protein [Verrucomicrobia bacterium]|nr:MlaD family protein [Verrucomicrobiota bacterium]